MLAEPLEMATRCEDWHKLATNLNSNIPDTQYNDRDE
jgi:hypothetical protein